MAKKYIDADRLKQTIADNVYPVQDVFNSRDYGMFWTGGIEKAIDEAPAVDIPRWIPVTEGLPEEDGRYLITGKRGTVYSIEYEDGRWYGGIQPIAWMPLPSPFLGE